MTEEKRTVFVRVKFDTPIGTYFVPADEIEDTKTAYQDYVEEATSLLINPDRPNGVFSFTDHDGDVIFLMEGTIQNSIITVERL